MEKICVFCGSSRGVRPEYMQAAQELGRLLVRRRLDLVYGGAKVGLMGEIADAVLSEGGEVIGVMPKILVDKGVAHDGLSDLRVVASMHERKRVMAGLADGFIAMPGGFGTLEEFFETLTWAQLRMHQKPCGFLNTCQFYGRLLEFLNHAVEEQLIKEDYLSMIIVEESPEVLLDKFGVYRPPIIEKWIGL
jgi:uncharacterized protein (TIGR00730 family)